MPDHVEPVPSLAEELAGGRHVAPGGWKRAVVGFGIGIAAGLAAALAMPRKEGARRRDPQPRPAEPHPPERAVRDDR